MSSSPLGSAEGSDVPYDAWEFGWTYDVPFNAVAGFEEEISTAWTANAHSHAKSGDMAPSSRPNRLSKGTGSNSKSCAPDPYDNYPFERDSLAWFRLRLLGYTGISLQDLARVQRFIQIEAGSRGIVLSPRNRAARRRKPCGFHWLDENMRAIGRELFRRALISVLGHTTGTKKRGPKGYE
jgi:hypothetical protein